MTKKQRLSKVLASLGVASRRASEELIFEGKVKVNGQTALLPQTMVSLESDSIEVDGKSMSKDASKVYYLINKPFGYHCSPTRLKEHGKHVLDLFEDKGQRLMPVGRLDKESSGLAIITNDGQFVQKATLRTTKMTREYVVKAHEEVTHEHLCALSKGTMIDGSYMKPISVKKVRRGTVKVTVSDDKKGGITALFEMVGLTIHEMKRVRIGHLLLGNLEPGAWREMTSKERDSFTDEN